MNRLVWFSAFAVPGTIFSALLAIGTVEGGLISGSHAISWSIGAAFAYGLCGIINTHTKEQPND